MKSFLTLIGLALLGLAVGETEGGTVVGTEAEEEIESYFNYHETVGIPLATEIYEAETKGIEEDDPISRIVGGKVSEPGQWKHVGGMRITLTSGQESVCGSTLLSNERTVTAAHCWYDGRNQGKEVTLVFGSRKLYNIKEGEETKTKDVTTHEGWEPKILKNDIAIIKHGYISYTDNIQPMSLPTGDLAKNCDPGKTIIFAGFGRTGSADSGRITQDQVLRYVELEIARDDVCKSAFGEYYRETNICITGPKNTAKSTCQGDSGSGGIGIDGDKSCLCSIVSFGGRRCDRPNPIKKVHTKVTSYLDWILGYLG